jgi:CheY-like chemotaxis protein
MTVRKSSAILRAEAELSDRIVTSYAIELDETSVFLVTDALPPVGAKVALRLSLSRAIEPLAVNGVVSEVRLSSGPGAPSGFCVRFDSEETKRAEVGRFVRRLTAPRPFAARSELSVLLVEDNRLIRDMFSYAVCKYFRERSGVLHLDQADDAVSAWEKLAERRYDLVIVDYYLPMQDGATFIAKLRKEPRHADAPVVAISVGGSDVREATLSAGADIFLSKPLILRDLFQTLEFLMAREDVGVA